MTNLPREKAPSVYYVILGVSIVSLLVMLAIAYYQLANLASQNHSFSSFDLAQLAASILLNIAFIYLLFKRSKAAFTLAIVNLLAAVASLISLFLFQNPESRNVTVMIGQILPAVYCLLVALKLKEFCRNGLLR